jgi:hypothetical protein
MSMQALVVALATETFCTDGEGASCDQALAFFTAAAAGDATRLWVLCVVLGTCFLALLVNLSVFGVAGLLGPVSLQVIGHAKTCLVLAAGFVLFPSHGKHQHQQLLNQILGMSVAMAGVVLYGHLKTAAGGQQPDVFDMTCPACALSVIEPQTEGETESKAPLTSNA